jgi:hypothetical protein
MTYKVGDRLTAEDAAFCTTVLANVRAELETQADGDAIRLHALRRRVVKYLGYDEKSTPGERRALKKRKLAEQAGLCFLCGEALPTDGYYAVLDRRVAHLGYTDENVNLIHAHCDYANQEQKGFS